MGLTVQREDPSTAFQCTASLNIWEDPAIAPFLGETWWLVARHGHRVVGTWLVPIERTPRGPIATRAFRALPYAAPWLADHRPAHRRAVWTALLRTIKQEARGMELPLAPDFHDYGVVAAAGGFLEARHTHCVRELETFLDGLPPKARNHLAVAKAHVSVRAHSDVSCFDFDSAIVDSSLERIAKRREMALALAERGKVLVVEARAMDRLVGAVLAVLYGNQALIMHSWFDRRAGVRGVPTLLMVETTRTCLDKPGIHVVDFEGSIIASVDEFMDGLGVASVPFALAYWYPDRLLLMEHIGASLDIPGRTR